MLEMASCALALATNFINILKEERFKAIAKVF
jgi:hypothetical protein